MIEKDYTINKDYHGDVKFIRNKSKKVNLSKPTDILDHRVKSQMMPTLYSNSNPPQKINHSNKKICLTKPQDTFNTTKKTSFYYIPDKQEERKNKRFGIPLWVDIIISGFISVIIEYYINIDCRLIFCVLMFISGIIYTKLS